MNLQPDGPLLSESAAGSKIRRPMRNAILVFLAIITALTLLSNTALYYSLPRVKLETPVTGVLIRKATGTGVVLAEEIIDYYAEASWPIESIPVKPGDKVVPGQTLAIFNTEQAHEALLDEQARLEQRELMLQKLEYEFIQARQQNDDHAARYIMWDMDSVKLELDIQRRKVNRLKGQLETGARLTAKTAGIVAETGAGPGGGISAVPGAPLVRVVNNAKGYYFRAAIPAAQVAHFQTGEAAEIKLSGWESETLKGTIRSIRAPLPLAGAGAGAENSSINDSATRGVIAIVEIALSDKQLSGGEYGQLTLSKPMPPSSQLVSNAAIREDSAGWYVLVLQEKEGPLGTEYYARRASIESDGADERLTSITSGLGPLDYIIVSATKPIEDGSRVVIAL